MLLTLYSASPRGLCCLMVVQSISHLANDLLQHITTGQNPVKIINLRIICVTLTKFNFHICFFFINHGDRYCVHSFSSCVLFCSIPLSAKCIVKIPLLYHLFHCLPVPLLKLLSSELLLIYL